MTACLSLSYPKKLIPKPNYRPSLSSTVRLATINEFFMDTLIGTDENFNGQTELHIKVTVPSNAVSFAFQSSKVAVEVTAVNGAPVMNIISNSSLWGKCYPTVIVQRIGFGYQRRRHYRVARFISTS